MTTPTLARLVRRTAWALLPNAARCLGFCAVILSLWAGAVHAAPFAYIANSSSGDVSVIDIATNTVVATVGVGANPRGVAVNPAGTRAYVANFSSNTVSVIDTATNTVATTVMVGTGPAAFGLFIGGSVTTSNAFAFIPQTGVPLSTLITSNTITVAGINTASPISIVGGTYSINGAAYTAAAGTVNNGDTVTLRQTSSASYSTLTTATLTIGGVAGAFDVTTQAAPPAITNGPPPNGTPGVAYSFTYTSTGSPMFSVTVGALPPGLSLSAAGVISGTPTTAGTFNGTVTATNGATPDATQAFSITVTLIGQTISFGAAPTVVVGGGSGAVSASGGASGNPVTFTSTTTAVCSVSGTNGATVTGVSAGTCTIAANQAGNASYSAAPQVMQSFTVAVATRLINLSSRGQVQTDDNVMIGGFIIGGSSSKTVLIRAVGPNLANFGVPGVLANPTLQLFSGQTVIASNDDWGSAVNAAAIQASGLAPVSPLEAALLVTLAPGAYTAIISGAGGGTGVGIIEVFEMDNPSTPLINISTRGQVQTGNNVMIGGFIIQGTTSQTVLIRAVGPNLANFGVPGVLANPMLQLFSGQTVIASNDDWQSNTNAAAIQATGLAPANALEAALLVTLAPGAYTAIVSGVGGATGVGIVEVFAQ